MHYGNIVLSGRFIDRIYKLKCVLILFSNPEYAISPLMMIIIWDVL